MSTDKKSKISLSSHTKLIPQEEMLEIQKNKKSLTIGIPKEITYQENRVALAPAAVSLLVNNGHQIVVESNAGKNAHFPDNEYSDAGANIVYTPEEVYQTDIILKVGPPSFHEIEMFKTKQILLSALHLPIHQASYFKKLMEKKVTAIAFEYIQDKSGTFPITSAMSEIVGNTAVLIAAEYLSNATLGRGTMFGGFSGITPTEVVILGAGTVGEYAARAAIGLGALVKIFDNSTYKLRHLQNCINTRIFTSIIEPNVLTKALKTAHVAIGALHASEGKVPCIVNEEMIKQMKYGAIIVDISIDKGGCFETSHATTHEKPVFKKHDVIHYCVPNIPSRVPRTASYALSNFFGPKLLKIAEVGGVESNLKNDDYFRKGVYIYNGILTSKYIGDYFELPHQNIELLMAAFQ